MPPRQAKWKLLSDEELSNVVRSSNSWTDVAKKVQTSHCGKRLSEFKLAIANRNLSTDHFKGLNYERKLKPVSELTRGRRNCAILTRMLEDSGRKYICEICECRKYKPIDNNGRPAWLWQGKITTLEVDHINGNCGDDSLNNLRFLCTTCHTLTPTYGFKKKESIVHWMQNKQNGGKNKTLSSIVFARSEFPCNPIRHFLRAITPTKPQTAVGMHMFSVNGYCKVEKNTSARCANARSMSWSTASGSGRGRNCVCRSTTSSHGGAT